MAGSRRPLLLLLLPLLSTGVELLAGSVPVAASGCSGAYVAQLGQVRSELTEGGSVPAAEEQLQTLASADHAASALDPVIADLQSGDLAGAERLLGATVAALQVSG
ncbi:MAG: hypothetical protein WB802_13745, partial [Candidatus Dormiibacterota bacterium]